MKKERAFDYDQYNREVLLDTQRESRKYDPVARRCRYVSFVSESNGRRRKKRRQREVNLLIVEGIYGKHVYQIVGGELRPKVRRRTPDTPEPDQLAVEILEDTPPEERSVERLLQRVKELASQ